MVNLFIIAFLPLIFLAFDLASTMIGLLLGGRDQFLTPLHVSLSIGFAILPLLFVAVAKKAEISMNKLLFILVPLAGRCFVIHVIAGVQNCLLIIQWLIT